MIHNILVLAALTVVSALLAGMIGLIRNKGWNDFDRWWNAEGVPIFIMCWFGLGVVLVAHGCLKAV